MEDIAQMLAAMYLAYSQQYVQANGSLNQAAGPA
jgi:hypothetical protein